MSYDNLEVATPDYMTVTSGFDGVYGSVGGLALRDSLKRGSTEGVMDLLKSMDAQGVAESLRDAGFLVNGALVAQGRSAVFESIKPDLSAAMDLKVDGFGLARARARAKFMPQPEQGTSVMGTPFVAKVSPVVAAAAKPASPLPATAQMMADMDAVKIIQAVMHSSSITVDLLGQSTLRERSSLMLVAAQGLQKGIQGFGFEGIEGKYQVPLRLDEIVSLHQDAARAVATESTQLGLASWINGKKVTDLNAWVPDSVQRMLYGSVSLASAKIVMQAITQGGIDSHAGDIGLHEISGLLSAQGLDPNAPTVNTQINNLGLSVVKPNSDRGRYAGPVIALDHRAAMIKFSRNEVIELSLSALAKDNIKIKLNDKVRMEFDSGSLNVRVDERLARNDSVTR